MEGEREFLNTFEKEPQHNMKLRLIFYGMANLIIPQRAMD